MKYSTVSGCIAVGMMAIATALPAQVTPHDIISLNRLGEVQTSPDSSLIAYTVTTPTPANATKNIHVWISPAAAAGQQHIFTLSDATETSPRFSPDGRMLAFLSDRKNPITLDGSSPYPFHLTAIESRPELTEAIPAPAKDMPADAKKDAVKTANQIWMMPLTGGEAVPLTNIPGGVTLFRWSPDGKQIAFIRKDEDTRSQREAKERKQDSYSVNSDYRYDRLYIYTLADHTARLLTTGDRNIDDFDWSPDGTQLVARVSPTPRINDFWRNSKIQMLSATTGEVERTLCERAFSSNVHWSADGDHITYGRETEKEITGFQAMYSLKSGKETVVGSNLPVTWDALTWSGDGKQLIATGLERATGVVADINLQTGAANIRSKRSFNERNVTVNRDGSLIAAIAETSRHPGEVTTLRGSSWSTLTESNPQVNGWKLGDEREVSWKSKQDGKTIYGVLLLPSDYQKGQRYKTLVQLHGGPEGSWDTGWLGSWHDWARMMTTHGYAVFLPNPRGSDGQGPAFTESNYRDWGGGDFEDVMDGVDAMIAEGVVDPKRMVVGGWSYGGFMTSWTVTHTDRFRAAIIGAGVTDLFSMATITDISPDFLGGYFGPMAENVARYDSHSPIRFLSQCHTPTLVIHGEADERVPMSQGQEFYNGLRFMGRETEMVRYPREPHIFAEMDHQVDLLTRVLAWYDNHLQ